MRALFGILELYQKILSPDHGWPSRFFPYGWCRFYPSCSSYMKESLGRYGWRGVALGARRVARCHPWERGGIDPVPSR